jgi:hypothetical protein
MNKEQFLVLVKAYNTKKNSWILDNVLIEIKVVKLRKCSMENIDIKLSF